MRMPQDTPDDRGGASSPSGPSAHGNSISSCSLLSSTLLQARPWSSMACELARQQLDTGARAARRDRTEQRERRPLDDRLQRW